MPTPQALPYAQNFSTFNGSQTTYPAGWQGWEIGTNESTTLDLNAPATDQALVAGVTNGSTSAAIGDIVGKMFILSSGSHEKAMCLAINTTGVTNVLVTYTAAIQGQLVGGSTRVDELDLEYRVGQTGSFTAVSGATYQNDGLTVINSGTTSSNPSTISVLLPVACENQPTVQVRWVERDVTGSGGRPSLSIANVSVQHATITNYYSAATGNLNAVGTWGTNTDGSGTHPSNFTSPFQEFHIVNGNPGNLTAAWTVSGTSSKIVVDGTDFMVPATNAVTATIDVNANRTLTLANATLPTLGTLDAASTVVFKNLASLAVPVSSTYGNIKFDGTTVPTPVANASIIFAGNFSLVNSSSISADFATYGYNLVTIGNNNQVISGNGNSFTIRNFDVGSTNTKTAGTVSLAANTPVTSTNSLLMNLTGPAAKFSDGGNIIGVDNNIDLTGNAAGYNFTGTLNVNAQGSGSANFRGGGSSSNPCVAAFNNVTFNNTIPIQIRPSGGAVTLTVNGSLIVSGTANAAINFNGNTLAVAGNVTYNATTDNLNMTTVGSVLDFNGTSAQSYSSAVPGGNTVTNVTLNNTSGLILNNQLNITDSLLFAAGKISTGANVLSFDVTATVVNAGSSSYVNGNLSKAMPAGGTTSMTYETGDVTYAPVTLTFSSSVNSGSVTVRSTSGLHPQVAGAYLNTSDMVNRYWTVTGSGVAPSTVNLALSYNSGDITSGTVNSDYIIRQYSGSAWSTAPSVTNSTSASVPLDPYATTTTGVTGSSYSGDYVAGQPACGTPAPGTATPTPVALCASGSSAVSLSGESTGNSIGYQWYSSPDGSSWSLINGATNANYTTPTITATTYYKNTLTCLLTTNTATSSTATVTVNPLPQPISASATSVCSGFTVTLSDNTAGGTWSIANTSFATVDASGIVHATAAGNPVITYTLPTTCKTTQTITVNPTPPAIIGATSLCNGLTTTLSNTLAGGTWSSSSTAIATVDANSGLVTSGSLGTTVITYATPASCMITSTLTVLSSPPGITAPATICTDRPTALSDAGGGTWSSDNTSIALVDPATGVITGMSAGTTAITYSLGTGCSSSFTITVNTSPADVVVPPSLCFGSTVTATDATPGGTWSSNPSGIVAINPFTHVVSGISAGTTAITYGISNGCTSIASFTVNPTSPIQGVSVICIGGSMVVSDLVPDGTWSSSNTAVVTVDPVSGFVSANGVGNATITYTTPPGCTQIALATVNPLPDVYTVMGTASYCSGTGGVDLTLSNSDLGINYTLYNGSSLVGLFPGTGSTLDFGMQAAAGTYSVMAANATTACTNNMDGGATVSILPLPGNYTVAGGSYCAGDTGVHVTLSGSASGINYSLYYSGALIGGPLAGSGSALDFGLQTAAGTYTVVATDGTSGCMSTMAPDGIVTINLLPDVYNVTGGGSYCAGGTGVSIGLDNSQGHTIKYQLMQGTSASGAPVSGVDGTLTFGLQTVAGTYKVVATDSATGCISPMNDSAIVTVTALVTPSVNISTGLGEGNAVCLGVPVTFTAQTMNGGLTPVYHWRINSINVGTTDSIYTYTPVNGDVIRVKMLSDAACAVPDSAMNIMTVNVDTPAAPSVFIIVKPLTALNIGQSDTLIAVVTNGGPSPSYQWYKNGSVIAGATSAVYIASDFANHDSVSCRVISSGGCGGVVTYNSVIITVYPAGVAPVTTGSDMVMYPNPNTGSFTVKGNLGTTGDREVTLTVVDMLGKVIYNGMVTAHNGSLNEQIILDNSVANGMYLLNVQAGTENKVFHFMIGK